jgi:hypothetical protein
MGVQYGQSGLPHHARHSATYRVEEGEFTNFCRSLEFKACGKRLCGRSINLQSQAATPEGGWVSVRTGVV